MTWLFWNSEELNIHHPPFQPEWGDGWMKNCGKWLLTQVGRKPILDLLTMKAFGWGSRC
jgi:hypothetical protein